MQKLTTLEDFPKFVVSASHRGPTSDTGYTTFEFDGNFDRIIENIDPHWFWLLFGEQDYICASLKSTAKETGVATLTCDARDEPKIVGQTLAYLSPYWQAYHVWMVLDGNWGWEKREFQGADAVAEDYEAKDVSIVAGREVKVWTNWNPLKEGEARVDIIRRPIKLCLLSPDRDWFPLGGVTSTASCATPISTRGISDTVIPENVGCARSAMNDT